MAWPQSGVHCRRKLMGTTCTSSDSTVQVPSDQIEFHSPHSPRLAIQSIRSVLPRQPQHGQKQTFVIAQMAKPWGQARVSQTSSLALSSASRLNSELYRFLVVPIAHLPAHYRAHLKVSTKPGQDLEP